MTTEPWAYVGDPQPAFPPAGFIDGDMPGLPYEQAMALRSLEAAERAEERKRAERLAERREAAENIAFAEAARRAHLVGQPWDPSRPLAHYPSREQRVAEAFAVMDMQAAAELRVARAAAAKVLREHGVAATVVIDANEPRPSPGGSSSRLPGEPPPTPGTSEDGTPPGSAQRARVPARGPGVARGPGEAQYVRMRLARFRNRVGRNAR
jgi:hypothetical protein